MNHMVRIIISNAASVPIYEQIANQIKTQIINGELQAGNPLPSIRKLAKELQISVITTKRAYEELEKEGFIDTVSGKGTFVALQNKELLKEKKLKIIENILNQAVDEARFLGIEKKELKQMLDLLYEESEE